MKKIIITCVLLTSFTSFAAELVCGSGVATYLHVAVDGAMKEVNKKIEGKQSVSDLRVTTNIAENTDNLIHVVACVVVKD